MSENLKSSEYLDEVRQALTKLSQQLKVDGIRCADAQAAIESAKDELHHVAIDIEEKVYGGLQWEGTSEDA